MQEDAGQESLFKKTVRLVDLVRNAFNLNPENFAKVSAIKPETKRWLMSKLDEKTMRHLVETLGVLRSNVEALLKEAEKSQDDISRQDDTSSDTPATQVKKLH